MANALTETFDIEPMLRSMRACVNVRGGSKLPNTDYVCVEDFVLKHGHQYLYQPLPSHYKRMMPKRCFHNAARMCFKHDHLRYVEGYAALSDVSLPILHAWCVEVGSDKVIDPTAEYTRVYFGIPFKTEAVRSWHKSSSESTSLLADWRRGWPLLQLSPEELRAIVAND